MFKTGSVDTSVIKYRRSRWVNKNF